MTLRIDPGLRLRFQLLRTQSLMLRRVRNIYEENNRNTQGVYSLGILLDSDNAYYVKTITSS